MKKWVRGVIAIVIAILVNVLSIGGVIWWCKQIDKKQDAPVSVEATISNEGAVAADGE